MCHQNSKQVERCIFRSLSVFLGSARPSTTKLQIGLLSISQICITRDCRSAEAEAGAWAPSGHYLVYLFANSSWIKNRFKLAWCSNVSSTWSVGCFSLKLRFLLFYSPGRKNFNTISKLMGHLCISVLLHWL